MRQFEADDDEDDFENPDDSETDPGEQLDDAETVPCPHCRRQVYEQSEQCPYCKKYISAEDAPVRLPLWFWIAAIACVVAVMLWMIR